MTSEAKNVETISSSEEKTSPESENVKQVVLQQGSTKTLANKIAMGANSNRNKNKNRKSDDIEPSSTEESTKTGTSISANYDNNEEIPELSETQTNEKEAGTTTEEAEAAEETPAENEPEMENAPIENEAVEAPTPSINTKNANKNKKQMDSLNQVCINMFNHYISMKLYHFQTLHYGAHKTSDSYIEHYLGLMDRFLEVAQGIYGKVNLKKYDIKGSSHDDTNIFNHINGFIKYLSTGMDDVLDNRTDLINIRDELLSEANQLKYLLTFN